MTDRDELVEQVAELIGGEDWEAGCIPDPRSPLYYRRNALRQEARAVILATLKGVREPDDSMCWAGWRAEGAVFSGEIQPMYATAQCYRAMVDRLIKDFEA